MYDIGFEFLDEAERKREFNQAEDLFLSDPDITKIRRTRLATDATPGAVFKHSYLKRSDGKVFAIAHEIKSSRFYTLPVTQITDTDCYSYYGRCLFYIFPTGVSQRVHLDRAPEFQRRISPFIKHTGSGFSTLSSEDVKLIFQNQHADLMRPGAFLGRGAYGRVKYAMDIDGQLFALKITHTTKGAEAEVAQKMGIMDGSPIQRTGKFYYIFRFLGSSLEDKLQSHTLTLIQKISIAKQLCLAVNAMHAIGLAHGDIKPGNVMITHQNEVNLADFGLSAEISSPIVRISGTKIYLPNSCLLPGRDDGFDIEKLKCYGRRRLDYIALQKTLFQAQLADHQRLFSGEECALLGSKIYPLFQEGRLNNEHDLDLLVSAFDELLAPPVKGDIEIIQDFFDEWRLLAEVVGENIYLNIMRQLEYLLSKERMSHSVACSETPACDDARIALKLLDDIRHIHPVHQIRLLPFFVYRIRKTILGQLDPRNLLNMVSGLDMSVQKILFTQTDSEKNNLCMFATIHSFKFAHYFWMKLAEFDRATQADILQQRNMDDSDLFILAMENGLSVTLSISMIKQLDTVHQYQIFTYCTPDGLNAVMNCMQKSPHFVPEYLNEIQSLDSSVLSRMCLQSHVGWNILMYCIVDCLQCVPKLFDIIDHLAYPVQRAMLLQVNQQGFNSLALATHSNAVPDVCLIRAINRLDIFAQIEIFKVFKDRNVHYLSKLKNAITFNCNNMNEFQMLCDLADRLPPLMREALLLCATQTNIDQLISMAQLPQPYGDGPFSSRVKALEKKVVQVTQTSQLTSESLFSSKPMRKKQKVDTVNTDNTPSI